ncbi:unnamed protein product, partial [Iphiclides podalirius]
MLTKNVGIIGVGTAVYYEIVKSQRGKKLLLIDGFTFSKANQNHWVCSRKVVGCKARLKLDDDGYIVSLYNDHCHPPRKFARTETGEVVRMPRKKCVFYGLENKKLYSF